MKTWLKQISVIVGMLALGYWLWQAVPAGNDECVICTHIKSHAPCVLNLATGEIGELELYQPHASKVGEIAEEQSGGTFSFIRPAGLQGIRMTDPWYIELSVPDEGEYKNNAWYCLQCRRILERYGNGYVLLDLYEKECVMAYSILPNMEYEIRCYRITISDLQESDHFQIRIDGKHPD